MVMFARVPASSSMADSPRRTGTSTVPADMPTTRYGKPRFKANGHIIYDLEWPSITRFEANKVADWIKFMLRHKRKELILVLSGMSDNLNAKDPLIPVTVAGTYMTTGVTNLLMDLASDTSTYQPNTLADPSSYKVSISVTVRCTLTLLSYLFSAYWSCHFCALEPAQMPRILADG